MIHLREVGPSRKILHARGVGSERRKSVTRVPGSWGALGATRKIIVLSGRLVFWPLQGPPISGASMRRLLCSLLILGFSKKRLKITVFAQFTLICWHRLVLNIAHFALWIGTFGTLGATRNIIILSVRQVFWPLQRPLFQSALRSQFLHHLH